MLYDKRATSLKDKLMEQDREAKAFAAKERRVKKEKVEVKSKKKKK